ncbi:ATP-binding cassette domain-containing protein [uncultured Clostridium sp.]|uniref:ABC transporter ATP-binding protein n=1 Tax=uncultured Clostridium sp. TaxID=59620 RepID=UPI00262C1BB6|nr:ATP-binding cassette domain-containing protein [uncultured Clostridium sp.]
MITVENLSKDFKIKVKGEGLKGAFKGLFSNEYEVKSAVKNISFTIDEGEVVGYIGSNGAGKSTSIKMMTGILTPTEGKVTVNGRVPYKEREKNAKDIGVVFGQRTQLWWDIPLRETFKILKVIYDISDEDFNEKMSFLNGVLELEDFMERPVRTLSLGQRMRADIAASLIHGPKVLYLDEPTIGLDVVVKERVREAIKILNEKYNTTVILTTHDLSDIEELCSRIIIIDKGTKLYDGDLEDIKNKFGFIKILNIKIKETLKNKLNIGEMLSLNEKDLIEEIGDREIIVKFNRNKTTSSEIISEIIHKVNIVDFTIEETSLEEIIKKIYRDEV